MFDSVRGIQRELRSETNGAEIDYTATNYSLKSFDIDGFTVGDITAGNYNVNGAVGGTYSGNAEFVAWNWKAGGAARNNTDGSIASLVSANVDAGFSIVQYTGTGSLATVGHGLNQPVELILVKNTSASASWAVYSAPTGINKFLELNSAGAAISYSNYWGAATPTNDVFGVVNGNFNNNATNASLIAYCFHSVSGYSKIGSYTGSGTSDFDINVGFRPRFLLIKSTTSSQDWAMSDSTRNPGTPPYAAYRNLYANLNNSEGVASPPATNSYVEYRATGFGFTAAMINAGTNPAYWSNGNTYIYLAIA